MNTRSPYHRIQESFRGTLLGLAIGDAIGTTLEFRVPGTFNKISDMMGGGPFNLEPGQWTDDTSMALCLASSLIEKRKFDPVDQMERYCRWWHTGYFSSTGKLVDIGSNTVRALDNFERTGLPYSGPTDEKSAGNGSLMRLAPVAMMYHKVPEIALENAALSSRTTHGNIKSVDSCRYFAGLLIGIFQEKSKKDVLSSCFAPVKEYWSTHKLDDSVLNVAKGSYKTIQPPEIAAKGYVIKTLEAALWAFYSTNNFREGCLKSVNLGEDADTVGAIYGQIAGAYYGEKGIPEKWRKKVFMSNEISEISDRLLSISPDKNHVS
jgi:ADP-ribosyl-[dinitrogen reductase] hydrolase